MKGPSPNFSIPVDPSNPGQFFASCGLLELAHLVWPGAEGWFTENFFQIALPDPSVKMDHFMARLRTAELDCDDQTLDEKVRPLRLSLSCGGPISESAPCSLRLDWWLDESGGGKSLKIWAGGQSVTALSRALLHAVRSMSEDNNDWFNYSTLVEDISRNGKQKKRNTSEKSLKPFYFDARSYIHALDTGFSLDAVEIPAMAYPAVEFFALVGLQRFRPREKDPKSYEYFTWIYPLDILIAPAVACGAVPLARGQGFRFWLRFRDDQKRYKAFSYAIPIGGEINE